jgi:helicase MOV-10
LIQVAAAPSKLYVFDVLACPAIMGDGGLAAWLADARRLLVMHDCRQDSVALRGQFGVSLASVFDSSPAFSVLEGGPKTRVGLNVVLNKYAGGQQNNLKDSVDHARWNERPLPPNMIQYAALDTRWIVDAFLTMRSTATSAQLAEIWKESQKNVHLHDDRPAVGISLEFWDHIVANSALRARCDSREGFKTCFADWQGRRGGQLVDVFEVMIELSKSGIIDWRSTSKTVLPEEGQSGAALLRSVVDHGHASRAELEGDKHGIRLEVRRDMDSVVTVGTKGTYIVRVHGDGLGPRPSAWEYHGAKLIGQGQRNRISAFDLIPVIPSGGDEHFDIRVTCSPIESGVTRTILRLQFATPASNRRLFSISRFIEVRCGDADIIDALKPSSPFVRKQRKRRDGDFQRAEPGQPLPDSPDLQPFAIKVGGHDIPGDWRLSLQQKLAQSMLEVSAESLQSQYRLHFQRLLWSEEIQNTIDIQMYDMPGTSFEPIGAHLRLAVPGLAENRPSVLKGDRVIVRRAGEARRFEGIVHVAERDDLRLKLSPNFHRAYIRGQRVDIEFQYNRSVMRLFHQGCSLASQLPPAVLFPPPVRGSASKRCELGALRHNRDLNERQLAAVAGVVEGIARPCPYLIYGPPGTGKTVTVVECIMQLYKQHGGAILACAPTNTAADLFVERLAKYSVPPRDMLRLMAFSRPRTAVSDQVSPYTFWDGHNFKSPAKADILGRKIVIGTLATAAKLHNLGVPRGHFETIFVDEGGQALEPEAVAPVAPLLGADGLLVLAGDPKQLGPVVHSAVANEAGLGMSLLERMISRPIYARDNTRHAAHGGFDPACIQKLVDNYRSHPQILELPNSLFYEGDLVPRADPGVSRNLEDWEHLPTQGVPLIFHGIEGKDEREGNSPSWFNADEAALVVHYVKLLLETRRNPIRPEEIGVITPYTKQKQKLRRALLGTDELRALNMQDVKVGSTEEFQGQERRVIIISTVRSSDQYIEHDHRFKLGFLVNPKRFNVAITRAKALLIIIGNPRVLASDEHWAALLHSCIARGAYTGVPYDGIAAAEATAAQQGLGGDDALLAEMRSLMLDGDEDEPSQRMEQEQLEIQRFGE